MTTRRRPWPLRPFAAAITALTAVSAATPLAVVAILGLAGVAGVAAAAPAGAQSATIDAKRIFAQASPATVLILVDVAAQVSVPTPQADEAAVEAALTDEVLAGGIDPTDTQALWDRLLELLTSDPDRFLVEGAPVTTDAAFQISGSGFIIDQTGYVVTNAHVAAPSDDEVKQQLAEIGLKAYIDDLAEGIAQFQPTGVAPLTADQTTALIDATAGWLAQRLQITDLTKEVQVTLGAAIAGVTTTLDPIRAEVVSAGETVPGRDVAILKVEQDNLPTVPLGDDKPLTPGDQVYVIGYPGSATFHELLSPESFSEPTFTAGQVSARKTSSEGFEVIQIDAAITHGNSGGPVFNDRGEVIGIATFGSVDPATGAAEAGFNFIMPTTVAGDFIARSGAQPGESLFTTLYKKGLDQEERGRARAALDTFTQIDQLAPGHPYVQRHIAADQALVAAGQGGSDSGLTQTTVALLVIVGGGLLVVVAGILLALFLVLRATRGRRTPGGSTPFDRPPVAQPQYATASAPRAAPGAEPATAPPPATAAFCTNCGSAVQPGQRFCGSCGRPLG